MQRKLDGKDEQIAGLKRRLRRTREELDSYKTDVATAEKLRREMPYRRDTIGSAGRRTVQIVDGVEDLAQDARGSDTVGFMFALGA